MTQMMNRWICQSINRDRHNKYMNVYKMAWPKKCTLSQTVITVAETLHFAKAPLIKVELQSAVHYLKFVY